MSSSVEHGETKDPKGSIGVRALDPPSKVVESTREIRLGKLVHPMVQHFLEEHDGRRQSVLMKVITKHLQALERQVRESVNIEKSAKCKRRVSQFE